MKFFLSTLSSCMFMQHQKQQNFTRPNCAFCALLEDSEKRTLPLFLFCSLFSFDRSDKIFTCLKTCLWNPGTYRHKIVLLSSAQFGLVTKLYTHISISQLQPKKNEMGLIWSVSFFDINLFNVLRFFSFMLKKCPIKCLGF